ncbi:MAG: cation:proton antiporter [Planctomycetaceae bacterium]
MAFLETSIAVTFGLILAAAVVVGTIADFLRIPKVTAYLLVGILLGDSVWNVLPSEHVKDLHPLTQFALALVLFNLGGHFPAVHIRRILTRVLRLAAGEIFATFICVSLGLLVLTQDPHISFLLAALALATAPATTILVLKEANSEGPVTELTSALVIVNNVVCILAFELIFVCVQVVLEQSSAAAHIQLGWLLRDLAGSLFLGIVAGLMASYGCSLVAESKKLVLLIGLIGLLLGINEALHTPYMISFLAMGLTVANSAENPQRMIKRLDHPTAFLCVVFFVIHGAELELDKLWNAGLIGAGYIVFRSCGKFFGIFTAGKLGGEPEAVHRWLGLALVAQAGAAIALAEIAQERAPELGAQLQTIILGTVVFFEIAGPLLIRQSVLHAGEVPLLYAIHHTSASPLEELKGLWSRLVAASGQVPKNLRDPDKITVKDVVRKNVESLHEDARFDEVVAWIAHSHDNTFPIVDAHAALVGVIRYADLSHVMFDPHVSTLVRATDLTTPADHLTPDACISDALTMFQTGRDDCIPVVTTEEPQRYLGIVRRRDVLGHFVPQETKRTADSDTPSTSEKSTTPDENNPWEEETEDVT